MPGRTITPDPVATDPAELCGAEPDDEPETGPLRRCAVTRERLPKERMIRFVVGPDRRIVPDLAARLPGRGIWLSALGDVIETACKRGAFAKAARAPVVVSPQLVADLRLALARRVVDTMGLARRAGQAVCGFVKAREWLESGRAGLIVQAHDGSPDERARFLGGRTQSVPVIAPLDAVGLGGVFGRDHAVHAAIAQGRLADMLWIEAERLAGLAPSVARQGPSGRAVTRLPQKGGRSMTNPAGEDGATPGRDAGEGRTIPAGAAGPEGDHPAEPGGSDASEAV
jgi:predicted RNA-binding protein YlxR (DUF448 family)